MRYLFARLVALSGLALFCGFVASLPQVQARVRPRIVNGTATGDYPEVGALLIRASPGDPDIVSICSGTLVGCRSFLTAAHCVCPITSDTATQCERQGVADPRELTVFLQHHGRVDVQAVFLNPDFSFTDGGDLALLRLTTPVDTVLPAVPNTVGRLPIGSDAVIVGFGNSGGPLSSQNDYGIKRFGTVRTSLCAADIEPATHVCWDYLGVGANTCGGDSGGPLFVSDADSIRLAGVTSGGESLTCTEPDNGFDTDIFVHLPWLEEALAASEGDEPCPEGTVVGDPSVTTTTADGVLARTDAFATVPVHVPVGTARLLVVLNGSLYSSESFTTPNEFTLSVRPEGAATATCVDSTLGPFDVCDVEDPSPGEWQARVGRLRGSGEYQLTATLFARTAPACAGDCNDDGVVDRAGIEAVPTRIFAAEAAPACVDRDGDGIAGAADLVATVRSYLGACPP